MAIEIRELIIRTKITTEPEQKQVSLGYLDKKELIEQCVQRVLKRLSKKTIR